MRLQNEDLEYVKKEIAKSRESTNRTGLLSRSCQDHRVQLYQDHDETVTQEYVAIGAGL